MNGDPDDGQRGQQEPQAQWDWNVVSEELIGAGSAATVRSLDFTPRFCTVGIHPCEEKEQDARRPVNRLSSSWEGFWRPAGS